MRFSPAFLIALLALSLAFPLLYSNVSPDRDEGVFLLIAREIKDGAVLYKDYVDNKPPGIYLLLIPVVLLAGVDVLKIRLAAGLVNYLTAVFIFLIGRKVGNEKVGAVAAVLYIVLVNGHEFVGFLLKTETISTLFICAAIYVLLQSEGKGWHYFMVGLLIALGLAVRQTAVYSLILVGYHAFKGGRHAWRKCALVCAGLAVGLLPFIFYLVSNGVLWDMIYYTTYGVSDVQNMNAIGPFNPGVSVGNIVLSFFSLTMLILFILASYSFESKMINGTYRRFIFLWVILVYLFSMTSPLINIYYLMMVMPPLAILAAVGVLEMPNELKVLNGGEIKAFWRYVRVILLALFIITLMVTPYSNKINRMRIEGNPYAGVVGLNDIGGMKDRIMEENATFYVVMTEPQLYYLLGSKSITRFPFMSPYIYLAGDEGAFKREVLDRLEEEKPQYIIVNNKWEFWMIPGMSKIQDSENFRKILEFIDEGYVEIGRSTEVILYARKESADQ